jgi:hypothetical protein
MTAFRFHSRAIATTVIPTAARAPCDVEDDELRCQRYDRAQSCRPPPVRPRNPDSFPPRLFPDDVRHFESVESGAQSSSSFGPSVPSRSSFSPRSCLPAFNLVRYFVQHRLHLIG